MDMSNNEYNDRTGHIWNEFNAKLRQFIRNRVPNDDTAKDILQDVFLKIHSRIDTLKNSQKLHSWVYQITRNTIIDYYRSRKPVSEIHETHAAREEDKTLEALEAMEELSLCIKEIVTELPVKYREALMLTEFQGLKQKELGEKLLLSGSGAKSRVQRARSKVKEILLMDCHYWLEEAGISPAYQPCCCCCCSSK